MATADWRHWGGPEQVQWDSAIEPNIRIALEPALAPLRLEDPLEHWVRPSASRNVRRLGKRCGVAWHAAWG